MQRGIGDQIFERFFAQLERETPDSRRLGEELRRLYDEGDLDQERTLIPLYKRLAEEGS